MALNIGTAVAYLEMDSSKFSGGIQTALNGLKKLVSGTEGVEGRLSGLSTALTTVGSGLTKSVTVPLVGVGAAAVKVASDFEAQMSKVKAISGATGEDFEKLRDKAVQMGNDTAFSQTEAAQAFEYMAMAGWKTEDMLGGIEGIMNLASASGEDLALTSDIVTDALTAFGMKADEAGHFADILAAASSNSNTNVAMMGETFKYVAPLAGSMGYAADEVAVAIGLMANGGIKASQAGTSLANILKRMVRPTKESGTAMDRLGLSVQNSDGTMKSFMELMLDLRGAFKNVNLSQDDYLKTLAELDAEVESGTMTDKQYADAVEELTNRTYGAEEANKAMYAAQLAGAYGLSGLLNIVNASDEDFEKLTKAVEGCTDETTGYSAAAEMAETMLDNFQGSVTLLKSALDGMAIVIGDRLSPYIRQLADFIRDLVTKFNELSPEQQDQIVKWGLIVAAIGPVLLILGKLVGIVASVVKGVKAIVEVFKLMGGIGTFITGPIGIAVVAIGALVAAFIYLWNNCEGFRKFWIDLWNNVKDFVSNAAAAIKEKFEQISKKWEDIKESMANGVENIKEFFTQKIPQALETFANKASEKLTQVKNFFTKTIPDALGKFANETVPNAINSIINWFKELPEKIFYNIGRALGHIYLFGTELGTKVVDLVGKGIDAIVTFFKELPGKILEFITNIIDNIKKWADNMMSVSKDMAKTFFRNIVDTLTSLPGKVLELITRVFDNVKKWASDMVKKAYEMARDFVENIVTFIKELPGKILGFITDTFNKVKNWAVDMKNKAVETGKNFLNGIVDFVKELPGKVYTFITDTLNKVKTWAVDLKNKAIEAGKNFLNGVVDFVKELPGKIYSFITDTLNKVKTWATDMKNKAIETGRDFVNNVINFFKNLPGNIKNFIDTTFNNIVAWSKNMINKAIETGKNFINNIVSFFKNLPGNIKNFIDNALTNVSNWATNMKNKALDAGKGFIDNVVNNVKNLPGNIKSKLDEGFSKVKEWATNLSNKGRDAAIDFSNNVKNNISTSGFREKGKNIMDAISGGMSSKMESIKETVSNWIASIKKLLNSLIKGFDDVVSSANKAKKAAREVDGKHANGLSYVPFNGYIAELHEGERVLTKEENRNYSQGRAASGTGDTFVFYNTKPDPYEYARQMKRAKEQILRTV